MSNISFNPLVWSIRPLYLKAIAEDELFAKIVKEKESRAEKPKSLAECADYIFGEAFQWAIEHPISNEMAYSGCPDDEVLNLIKHYYDEENIEIRKVNVPSRVTHTPAPASASPAPVAKTPAKVAKPNTTNVIPMQGLFAQPKPKAEPKKAPVTLDLFAGMWGDDKEEEKPKKEPVLQTAQEDDDDLPM